MVHYSQDHSNSRLQLLPMFHSEGTSRNICLDRITPSGLVVAAMSTYNANTGRGSIVLRPLDSKDAALAASPMADKKALAAATVSAPLPGEEYEFMFGQESTPFPTTKRAKVAGSVFLEETNSKLPEGVAIPFDDNQGKTTKSPEGVAVSPELKGELLEVAKKKTKKHGAMIKYLRPADAADKAIAKRVPRRLDPQTKTAPRESLLDDKPSKVAAAIVPRKTGMKIAAPLRPLNNNPLKTPKVDAAVVPRKPGEQLPPTKTKKKQSQSDIAKTAERLTATGTKIKKLYSFGSLKSDATSDIIKAAKEKRFRSKSPSVPRKRQEKPSAVTKRDATPIRNDSLGKWHLRTTRSTTR